MEAGIDGACEPEHEAQIAKGESGNFKMRGGSRASGEGWMDDEGCGEGKVLGWRKQGGREGGGAACEEGDEEVERLCIYSNYQLERSKKDRGTHTSLLRSR